MCYEDIAHSLFTALCFVEHYGERVIILMDSVDLYKPMQGRVKQADVYESTSASPLLNSWVSSFWCLSVPTGRYVYRSIPDNCVDWITNAHNPSESFLVPPFRQATAFDMRGPVKYIGVRFHILGHAEFCKRPIGEWPVNTTVDASDILCSDLFNTWHKWLIINEGASFDKIVMTLSDILRLFAQSNQSDRRLIEFIRQCAAPSMSSPLSRSPKIDDINIGLSERQLRRLCQLHLGLPPKAFARILRFQMTLQPNADWADAYFDQSHFIKEFKAMTGATPNQFSNMSVFYNSNNH